MRSLLGLDIETIIQIRAARRGNSSTRLRWPTPGSTRSSAPGINDAVCSLCAIGTSRSSASDRQAIAAGRPPWAVDYLGDIEPTGDVLVFLDDDMSLPRNFLSAHWRLHSHSSRPVVVLGNIQPSSGL